MKKVLGPAFFDRPTLTVAKELLGKFLVRRVGGKTVALMITETEAYDGPRDKANHAHRGQTPRNMPMFGHPATIYVYFTYGIHWMLNIVCGKSGYPAAVLIRGVANYAGILRSGEMNGSPTPSRNIPTPFLLNGPAKLTKFLKIDKSLSTKMLGKKSGLWIEDRGVVIKPRDIKRTPRIGINYAGEYAHKPWRFVLKKPQP
ncbi:MAG: DNA-3-methyladenine glycosylase [Parcubacteria group bacterium Gr01-1014_56]|nr:MAG: DNA-3-methyladenine glycosylase [Parcubacteria group bacterium Gr01-1014_56]